jgi:hypothetical protein
MVPAPAVVILVKVILCIDEIPDTVIDTLTHAAWPSPPSDLVSSHAGGSRAGPHYRGAPRPVDNAHDMTIVINGRGHFIAAPS